MKTLEVRPLVYEPELKIIEASTFLPPVMFFASHLLLVTAGDGLLGFGLTY